MSQTLPSEDGQLQFTIQQSLQDIAEQMGEPITAQRHQLSFIRKP